MVEGIIIGLFGVAIYTTASVTSLSIVLGTSGIDGLIKVFKKGKKGKGLGCLVAILSLAGYVLCYLLFLTASLFVCIT